MEKHSRSDTRLQTQGSEDLDGFRSGFVTLVGRPNAGKSTIINAVMGKKVAITSNTPQTTRHRFRAVLTSEDYQLILVDTPGIHKPHDVLGEELNRSAAKAIEAVDAICFVLDASKPFGSGDEWILETIKTTPTPKVLVVTKTDLVERATVEAQIEAATREYQFAAVCDISAHTGKNIDQFIGAVAAFLPPGPLWFPPDLTTDQAVEVIIAEFIREKVLTSTFEEVPHAVGVQVEELEYDEKKKLYSIYAIIYVERDSQKGILIGHHGERIKHIGTQARLDLTQFLGAKVFLDLRVKLRKNWRRDANQIRRFGYGEGA
jgi:GTP-binding protein Era